MSHKHDGSYDDDEDLEDEEEFLEEEAQHWVGVGFAAGILLGAALGAGVAVLFAPDKGSRTRRRISQRVRDLRENAEEKLDDARHDAGRTLTRQRRKIRGAVKRTTGRARDVVDDVLEAAPLSR
jgi:gas vesicle protein